MGVFDDKKFEELDWVSQAIEPIDSKLNEYLTSIPDDLEIDFDTYISIVGDSSDLDLTIDRAVRYFLRKANITASWEERELLEKYFKFEFSNPGGGCGLDFTTKEVVGNKIRLIKLLPTMDEKDLKRMMGRKGVDHLLNLRYYTKSEHVTRANEVLDLLGKGEQWAKSRSMRHKVRGITTRLSEIFRNDEWKIKDTELANKIGYWIHDYVADGNLSALSNFARLKVMTHKGDPIYSIEEVK